MQNDLVHQLPDSYAKPVVGREEETATNTWRLFCLTEAHADAFREEIESLGDMLDISACTGDALTKWGEMYQYPRKYGESDDVYRLKLLARIGTYFSDATANTILQAVANALGSEPGAVYFVETKPATVQIHLKSENILEQIPVTLSELRQMISDLLAVGVGIEDSIISDGTFQYCSVGEEKAASMTGTGYGDGTFSTVYDLAASAEP